MSRKDRVSDARRGHGETLSKNGSDFPVGVGTERGKRTRRRYRTSALTLVKMKKEKINRMEMIKKIMLKIINQITRHD